MTEQHGGEVHRIYQHIKDPTKWFPTSPLGERLIKETEQLIRKERMGLVEDVDLLTIDPGWRISHMKPRRSSAEIAGHFYFGVENNGFVNPNGQIRFRVNLRSKDPAHARAFNDILIAVNNRDTDGWRSRLSAILPPGFTIGIQEEATLDYLVRPEDVQMETVSTPTIMGPVDVTRWVYKGVLVHPAQLFVRPEDHPDFATVAGRTIAMWVWSLVQAATPFIPQQERLRPESSRYTDEGGMPLRQGIDWSAITKGVVGESR